MNKKHDLRCAYCGKFVKLRGKPYYITGSVSLWSFEPPDPELVCKKCYKEYTNRRKINGT